MSQPAPIAQFYVYCVAWDEDGPTKVGITNDVARRMLEIQWGVPYRLDLHFAYRQPTELEARDVERTVIEWFEERGCRLNGEWLDADIDRVRSMIIEVSERAAIEATAFCFSATDVEIKAVQKFMADNAIKEERDERRRQEYEARIAKQKATEASLLPPLLRQGAARETRSQEARDEEG